MRLRLGTVVARMFVLALWLVPSPSTEAQNLAAREQQLKQRVEEVYRLFVTGEWRKVEAYVSEDSRDLWFGQPKSAIEAYELGEIKLDPDGRRADVTVKATFRVPPVPVPFTMPQKGEWVFENEQWFLKVKPRPTMLEMFRATGAPLNPQASRSPFTFEQNPVVLPKAEGGSEIVVKVPFQNVIPTAVTVQELSTTCACLKAEMDKLQLRPEEHGILTVTYRATAGETPPSGLAIRGLLFTPAVYQLELPVALENP